MRPMGHRERVLTALNRQETDRVPLDFGSTIATTIIKPAYENLKAYLGMDHETKIMARRGRTVVPDEAVLQRFDIDTRPLVLGDFTGGGYREIDPETLVDLWGTTWKRAPDGHYVNVNGPFQGRDPEIEILESFQWPNPDDPGLYRGLREKAEDLRRRTDYALVLSLPVGVVHQCQFMRGFAEWLVDLHENPGFACAMMDRVAEIWIRIAQNAVDAVGDGVDVIAWGDDIAMQQSTFFSPKVYRDLIKPRHRRMIEATKSRSRAKVKYHSCGSVYAVIGDLIEIGVDALNPIQVSARNMEPERLKKEFGGRLAFWGGVDTHRALPYGTPEEVRQTVRRLIDSLGKGGGYILASVHNIQAEVPPENIVAMFEEGRSYSLLRSLSLPPYGKG